MTKAYRFWIAGFTLAGTIVLIDSAALESCPRLFSGGLLIRARCTPMIVERCESAATPMTPQPTPKPPPAVKKDLRTSVKEIAELLKRGETTAARKLAAATAAEVEEIAEVMHMYRARSKGGLGWGSNPRDNGKQDGIEAGLKRLHLGSAITPEKDNETVAFWIAALAEITLAKAPKSSSLRKTKGRWVECAEGVREASLQLARSSAINDIKGIKTAAAKIDNSCTLCHVVFKE